MRMMLLTGLLMAGTMGTAGATEPETGKAESATRAAIERVQTIDPKVNSVIAVDPTALDQARAVDQSGVAGPLAGVPILLKDNIEAKGPLPTTAGSLALADNVTDRDSPLVAGLRSAGAVILGKTNLSEWANIRSSNSISGWSAVGGQSRNPYALNRNTCGSSSGSGAAVAAGIVDYAVGTETDGSVTCPASINGIVGFKPTVGLVSRSHIVPISHSQDTAGPMTRTVAQAAAMLTAMAGSDPADPATEEADARKLDYLAALDGASLKGKRLGVMRFASGFGTDEVFDEALKLLEAQGAVLVEIKEFDESPIGGPEFKVLLTELKVDLNAYLATTPDTVKTRTLADVIAFNKQHAATEMPLFGQDIFESAEATTGFDDAYLEARKVSFEAAGPNGIDKMMADNQLDALIGPTMPASWPIDAVHGDQISGGGGGSLAAVAGYPHLSVPMGLVRGLPVGLSFIGGKWQDAEMLRLGYAYEQARGEFPRPLFYPSIEESPAIAPSLEKAAH